MRYGLLALSFALLSGGGIAAQSALAITHADAPPISLATAQDGPGAVRLAVR